MRAERVKKSYIRRAAAGAAIVVILVLHFGVSQFISFQGETNVPVVEVVDKQAVENGAEYETKKPDAVTGTSTMQERVTPVSQPEEPAADTDAVKEPVIKKKEPRESKSERLRRVEKFLTGA